MLGVLVHFKFYTWLANCYLGHVLEIFAWTAHGLHWNPAHFRLCINFWARGLGIDLMGFTQILIDLTEVWLKLVKDPVSTESLDFPCICVTRSSFAESKWVLQVCPISKTQPQARINAHEIWTIWIIPPFSPGPTPIRHFQPSTSWTWKWTDWPTSMKNFSAKFSKYFLYIEFAKEVKYFNIEIFIDLNNCWFTLEKKHNLQTQDIPNLKCRYYDPYRILYSIDLFFFFSHSLLRCCKKIRSMTICSTI